MAHVVTSGHFENDKGAGSGQRRASVLTRAAHVGAVTTGSKRHVDPAPPRRRRVLLQPRADRGIAKVSALPSPSLPSRNEAQTERWVVFARGWVWVRRLRRDRAPPRAGPGRAAGILRPRPEPGRRPTEGGPRPAKVGNR
jgi:hypothetical protein